LGLDLVILDSFPSLMILCTSIKASLHPVLSPASPSPAHRYNKTTVQDEPYRVYEHKLVNLALEQALLFLTAFV